MRVQRTRTRTRRELGASTTEFVIVAPVMLMLGLGTVQAGLLYHGKSTLNYATFEAARTGATHHALPGPMREELGVRLAPLIGGDGGAAKAAAAIARSRLEVTLPTTRLEIISPTPAAFDDWGAISSESGKRVIPNSHLRSRPRDIAGGSGMTLQDANLLKIKVTHGLELKVPLVNRLLTAAMSKVDPEHAYFYAANRFPLKSVATVRMQSEAWQEALADSNATPPAPPAAAVDDAVASADPDRLAPGGAEDAGGNAGGTGDADGTGDASGCVAGIPSESSVVAESRYSAVNCTSSVDAGATNPIEEIIPNGNGPQSPVVVPAC